MIRLTGINYGKKKHRSLRRHWLCMAIALTRSICTAFIYWYLKTSRYTRRGNISVCKETSGMVAMNAINPTASVWGERVRDYLSGFT